MDSTIRRRYLIYESHPIVQDITRCLQGFIFRTGAEHPLALARVAPDRLRAHPDLTCFYRLALCTND